MARRALLLDLGRIGYGAAWGLQKHIWQLRVADRIPDALILVEHPHVITLGKSGRPQNLLVSEPELKRRGVELYRVERGGDITYHGPGQLVGYPIFRLADALAGVRAFVAGIEESLIRALRAWNIRAERRPKLTGVWVGNDKIAALGIAVRRHVTFHGFALNVNDDLSYFSLIRPCGLTDMGVTSMARVAGKAIPMSAVKHQVGAAFEPVFDLRFELTRLGLSRETPDALRITPDSQCAKRDA